MTNTGFHAFCTVIGFLASAIAQAQSSVSILHLSPQQTVKVGEVIQRDNKLAQPGATAELSIEKISQAETSWAALVPVSGGSAIVIGQGTSLHSFTTSRKVVNLALDLEGHLHLLGINRESGLGEVSIVDQSGSELGAYSLPVKRAAPILTEAGVAWKAPGIFVSQQTFTPLLQLNGKRDPNDDTPQLVVVGSLPNGGGYYTFGNLSEIVTIHGSDGAVVKSYPVPLDVAFEAIGVSFVKPQPPTDASRVMWAAPTQSGQLYICLSGTRASGPAFLVVVDVESGRIEKVISADLPRSAEAVASNNPNGTMLPSDGAMGKHLVIVDRGQGLVATY